MVKFLETSRQWGYIVILLAHDDKGSCNIPKNVKQKDINMSVILRNKIFLTT